MPRWAKNYGFATLVVAGAAVAIYAAATVATPNPVPDSALQAEEVYRLEIGMAFFVAFYLVAMALVLAIEAAGSYLPSEKDRPPHASQAQAGHLSSRTCGGAAELA